MSAEPPPPDSTIPMDVDLDEGPGPPRGRRRRDSGGSSRRLVPVVEQWRTAQDDVDSVRGHAGTAESGASDISRPRSNVASCVSRGHARRSSSCPSEIRSLAGPGGGGDGAASPVDWRFMALDTFPDDGAVSRAASSPRHPDIDVSVLLMRTLSKGVSDARGFQRQKSKRAGEAAAAAAAAASAMGPPKRKRSDEPTVVCAVCSTDDTPMWRPGPAGSRTLCNVCGLLYARREKRRHTAEKARRH